MSNWIKGKTNEPFVNANMIELLETGFRPQYSICDAIKEIKIMFEDGMIDGSEEKYTVKWMKKLGLSES